MHEIVEASSPAELERVRQLFREYKSSVGVDLWFGGFDRELAALPEPYARPGGRLFLLLDGGEAAGCGGLCPMAPEVAEMKRMWLRPAHRGKGLGRAVAAALVAAAREEGYRSVRLETLSVMPTARELYKAMGFREIPHEKKDPFPGSVLMEMRL